jgi:predicted RNA-binding Zn-ribbon protein involved in translation (DUF1610 family)
MEQSVTFYDDQEWKLEEILTLNVQTEAQWIPNLEAELQQQIAEAKKGGIETSFRKETKGTDNVYFVSTESKGLLQLNQAAFQNSAAITLADGLINFAYTRNAFSADVAYVLHLTGGEIVESNANEIKSGTATWFNLRPGQTARAKLKPASKFGLLGMLFTIGRNIIFVFLGGLLFVLIGGALVVGLVLFVRPRLSGVVVATVPCPHCGKHNALTAKFCEKCGQKLTPQSAAATNACPACGKPNLDTAKFCEKCGSPLKPSAPA